MRAKREKIQCKPYLPELCLWHEIGSTNSNKMQCILTEAEGVENRWQSYLSSVTGMNWEEKYWLEGVGHRKGNCYFGQKAQQMRAECPEIKTVGAGRLITCCGGRECPWRWTAINRENRGGQGPALGDSCWKLRFYPEHWKTHFKTLSGGRLLSFTLKWTHLRSQKGNSLCFRRSVGKFATSPAGKPPQLSGAFCGNVSEVQPERLLVFLRGGSGNN